MDFKRDTKKRKIVDDKPLCKYGLFCYQKNPDHRKKFKHPSDKETNNKKFKANSVKDTLSKNNAEESETSDKELEVPKVTVAKELEVPKVTVAKEVDVDKSNGESTLSEDDDDDDSAYSAEETVDEILKLMPKDFFDFWTFCVSIKKSKPEDAFSDYGYHLVGVFDLLSKKLPKDMKVDISCHWRYFFDPPEFQTILKKDGTDLYHIGYFRDDPLKKSCILASNSATKDSKLTLMGDNVFCAMNAELSKVIKSLTSKPLKGKATELKKKLTNFAAAKKYELNIYTSKIAKREKEVVTKTFHGLGIVVPIKNDIGYRALPHSDAALKKILKSIVSTENKTQRLEEQEALDKVISFIHFANDECDYGMGLELGIDLFCNGHPYYHQYILGILPLAYDLLQRSKYAAIVKSHLKNRKKGGELSTLNI